MDFEFAVEHESFRKEFRDWLATNLPPELCLDDASDDRVASDRETFERRCVWQKTMHAAGWVGITWPKEYGGRDAGLIERVIWDEEYAAARAPVLPGNMGLSLVGPTIIHWGTPEQKRRHLPAILNADEIWCQGFSEPGAGSDLASLRTRAVDQGDHYVVNGQKVWTSGAHFAHWIILLVRTNPDVPKHQGISCLLVPMTTPGVSVRPLVADDGAPSLQRGLLHGRRRAEGEPARAGEPGMEGFDHHAHVRAPFGRRAQSHGPDRPPDRAGEAGPDRRAARVGSSGDPPAAGSARHRVRGAEVPRACAASPVSYAVRPPGPEGSVLKLSGSELGVRIADAAGELLGMHVLVNQASSTVPDAPRWFNRVLAARQYTISAGTSEIQRNIIGERVLGLPRLNGRLRPAASPGSAAARGRRPPADRGWRRAPPR